MVECLFCKQEVVGSSPILGSNILRSSNGRTAGLGPVNRGSNPCLRTIIMKGNTMNPNEISQLLDNPYLVLYSIATITIIVFLYVIFYKIKSIIANKVNALFNKGFKLWIKNFN